MAHNGQNRNFVRQLKRIGMALFSFRHSVRTFSDKRIKEGRQAKKGQTAAHLRYITRSQAARSILRERLVGTSDQHAADAAECDAERRKGRVCERFVIALPIEATYGQREELVRAFCEEITKGVAGYIAAIHDKVGNDVLNPHFHVAAFDVHVRTGGRGRPRSTLGMARKNAVERTAALWSELHNDLMRSWGYGDDSQISHLSFSSRGINRIAQIHEGPAVRAIARRGGEVAVRREWHHIDQGHSRAQANALIREINLLGEVWNEQGKCERLHRLGGVDGSLREELQKRGKADRTHCCGGSRSAGDSAPPLSSTYQDGNCPGGTKGKSAGPIKTASSFTERAPVQARQNSTLRQRLRGRGGVRRVFRELVMLRDTLRSRLLSKTKRYGHGLTSSLATDKALAERQLRARRSQGMDRT